VHVISPVVSSECVNIQEVMLQMRPTPSPSSVVREDSTSGKVEVPGTPTSAASLNQVSL